MYLHIIYLALLVFPCGYALKNLMNLHMFVWPQTVQVQRQVEQGGWLSAGCSAVVCVYCCKFIHDSHKCPISCAAAAAAYC